MTNPTLTRLKTANRQIDGVIRETTMMIRQARETRTVSKVMLILKLEALEAKAREVERTLELMTRDAMGRDFA
ncbi:MAG: hypothetical protein ACOH2H_15185 [Cypionkella sp.]